jgi:hypothetical protein
MHARVACGCHLLPWPHCPGAAWHCLDLGLRGLNPKPGGTAATLLAGEVWGRRAGVAWVGRGLFVLRVVCGDVSRARVVWCYA